MLIALLTLLPALAGGMADARSQVLMNPESAQAWLQLGDAYKARLKKKKARGAYGRAQGLEPDNLEVQARIADLGGGRSKLERKAMRRLHDDEIWGDLGDHYMAQGRNDEALAAFRYALSIDPEDGEWQGKISNLLGPEEVIEMIEAGDATMGDEELGDYADTLMAQGEPERACELYTRANALDPEDAEWIDKLSSSCGVNGLGYPGEYGVISELMGGYDMPEEALYSELTSLSGGVSELGDEAAVLSATGRAFALMGDDEQALEFFRRALEFSPGDERLRTAVLLMSDEPLVELLEALVLQDPESDELWGDLGDAYAAVGQKKQAARAWEQAVSLDPGDDEWGYKLGLVDPERALPDPAADSIRELLESE